MSTTATVTGPRALSPDQEKALEIWRALALEKMPYFAPAICALRPLDSPGLGTFAVDEHLRLYIDFAAVTPKGTTFCMESLLHEASHIFQQHAQAAREIRAGAAGGVGAGAAFDHQTFNFAADCANNDDLTAAGCVTFNTGEDPMPALIGEPDGKTPHHYYAVLANLQQQSQQQSQQQDGQGSPGNDESGQGQSGQGDQGGEDGQGKGPGQDPSGGQSGSGEQSGQGTAPSFKGCGSGSGGAAAPCELPADNDAGGVAPAASAPEVEAMILATSASIVEHATKGRGTVPGGLVAVAEIHLAPSKTRWEKVLAALIRRGAMSKIGPHDVTYTRPSRRHDGSVPGIDGEVIFPSMIAPRPTIAVVRDTSGSMSAGDLAACEREIEAIARQVGIRGRELTVTDVDARVYDTVAFTDRRSIAEAQGRGGTDMTVGILALAQPRNLRGGQPQRSKHRRRETTNGAPTPGRPSRRRGSAASAFPKPNLIVVLTDGETPWLQHSVGVPVVAAIIPQRGATEVPKYLLDRVPAWIKAVPVEPHS